MPDVVIEWVPGGVEAWINGDPEVIAALDVTAGRLVGVMKAKCPVSPYMPESGRMRSSIGAVRESPTSMLVGPTADYAIYVVQGTPPHVIQSKGPWPLRNPNTGQVFGRTVQHPGTAPNPFMQESVAELAAAVAVV